MKTLLDEQFAPITSSIGFIETPLAEAVDGLSIWRRSLGVLEQVEELAEPFPPALHALEPLTGGGRSRELLVRMSNGWTAYFDCSLRGTDAVTTVGYLALELGCRGVAIETVPHTATPRGGRLGSIQFQLFGPDEREFLNYVRTVALAHDGTRWVFVASGEEQDFEDLEAYRRRRPRDRFNTEMLEFYCSSLGIEVFDANSYGPDAFLVRSSQALGQGAIALTLDEVQRWLGIKPGAASGLPG